MPFPFPMQWRFGAHQVLEQSCSVVCLRTGWSLREATLPFRMGPIPPNLLAGGLFGQRRNQCTDQTINMRGMIIFAGRQWKASMRPALVAVKSYPLILLTDPKKISALSISGWDCGELFGSLCNGASEPMDHKRCVSRPV